MDLVVFENNKPLVLDAFREGRFDYVELASAVAETKFFQFLFGKQVVDRLAQHYPSPRQREHVPITPTEIERTPVGRRGPATGSRVMAPGPTPMTTKAA